MVLFWITNGDHNWSRINIYCFTFYLKKNSIKYSYKWIYFCEVRIFFREESPLKEQIYYNEKNHFIYISHINLFSENTYFTRRIHCKEITLNNNICLRHQRKIWKFFACWISYTLMDVLKSCYLIWKQFMVIILKDRFRVESFLKFSLVKNDFI